jgi:hypothetical protein
VRRGRIGSMDDRVAAERFRVACELHEFGVRMMESKFRREHPGASDEEIAALVRAWLLEDPPAVLPR